MKTNSPNNIRPVIFYPTIITAILVILSLFYFVLDNKIENPNTNDYTTDMGPSTDQSDTVETSINQTETLAELKNRKLILKELKDILSNSTFLDSETLTEQSFIHLDLNNTLDTKEKIENLLQATENAKAKKLANLIDQTQKKLKQFRSNLTEAQTLYDESIKLWAETNAKTSEAKLLLQICELNSELIENEKILYADLIDIQERLLNGNFDCPFEFIIYKIEAYIPIYNNYLSSLEKIKISFDEIDNLSEEMHSSYYDLHKFITQNISDTKKQLDFFYKTEINTTQIQENYIKYKELLNKLL